MVRLFKVLGIFVGVMLLLIAAAYVVLPMFIGPDKIKEEIVKQAREQTGRDLNITGDLDLSVFPWIGIKIDGVELSNAEGFGKAPFISVKHADVRVKLMPLLEKRVEVGTIKLDGVAINLIRKKDGTSNLDDLGKAGSDKADTGAQKTKDSQVVGVEGVSISGIDIQNARVSWDDHQSGKMYEIRELNLHSGAIVPGSPVGIHLDMLARSEAPAIDARIGLDGNIEINHADQQLNVRDLMITLDAEGAAIPQGKLKAELKTILLLALNGRAFALLDLKARSGSLDLSGEFKGANLDSDSPQFSGNIAIAEFNPRDWMSSQGMTPPVSADSDALNRFAATFSLSSKGSSTNINKLAIRLDDTKINGNATIRGSNTAFKLNVDSINLDRYLSANTNTSPTQDKKAGTSAASGKEQLLPLDSIRGLDLNGSINIGRLTVNDMLAEDLLLSLKASNGILQTTQKIGKFHQGSYNGTLDIDAKGNTPSLKLTSKLSGVQLESLLKNLAGEERINGKGNFNANLTASGNDSDSIKRSLNGTMDFNMLEGAIKGINLAAELRRAKAFFSGKSAPKETGPVQTDFSQIKGSETIKNGIMRNDDLQAFSPFFRVTGKGTANLVRETMDYTVNVFVVETSKGQGGHDLAGLEELERKKIGIPVRFTGSFASPKWEVQWKDVLLDEQKEKLKTKLEEKLIGDEKKDGEEESDKDKLKRKLLRKLIN